MSFLHPWAIWLGAIAVAAPVVVHLLTRPRPVRMPLSTLRFVREAVRQQRSRYRLRDLVILALRTLAIAALAMAVAQPQWGEKSLVSDGRSGDARRVVILDVSQSMAAVDGGIEGIERARTVAAQYLRYRPGLQANLILASATPRPVFEGMSANFDALREELGLCRALPERLDVNRALDAAAKMLAPDSPEDHRRRELLIVSDFQRANWAAADFGRLPEDTRIQLESTAAAPPNLAIVGATVRGRHCVGGNAQLEVEVGNFTPTARKVTVEATVAGATFRMEATCPAGRRTTLSEPIALGQPGWQPGVARLVDADGASTDDALAADNQRWFVVETRPKPVYALLTRQPAAQRSSSSRFLECALAPDGQRAEKASAVVLRVDPDDLDRQKLTAADLIVIDHPGKLSDEAIQLVAGLLRRGRPTIYVASESIDATNLSRLSDAAGTGLQMPVEFVPPPRGQVRRDLFLASVARDRRPFDVFGDYLDAITGPLRFAGGLASRRREHGVADDVLATYSDGSACLVLTTSDAGALATLNADLAESNLRQSPAFVPLLDELIQQMFDLNHSERTTECGEPLVAYLPVEAGGSGGLRVVGPEASPSGPEAEQPGRLADEGVGVAWRWTAPRPPGVYRVVREDEPVFALALNAPAEESNLEAIEGDVIRGRLAAGRQIAYHSATGDGDRRNDAWKWLAVGCVVCLVGELAALLALRT